MIRVQHDCKWRRKGSVLKKMKNGREYGICLGCYRVIAVSNSEDAPYLLWKMGSLKEAILQGKSD